MAKLFKSVVPCWRSGNKLLRQSQTTEEQLGLFAWRNLGTLSIFGHYPSFARLRCLHPLQHHQQPSRCKYEGVRPAHEKHLMRSLLWENVCQCSSFVCLSVADVLDSGMMREMGIVCFLNFSLLCLIHFFSNRKGSTNSRPVFG